jgi:hypothetical protein
LSRLVLTFAIAVVNDVGSRRSMNVLEIYPNYSLWFEAADAEQVQRLRAAARLHATDEQAEAFGKLAPARAFHLVGDAAAFDLMPGVFDEIIVHYTPGALRRLNLEDRMRTWIRPSGYYRFQPDFVDESERVREEQEHEYRPLLRSRF